jgi:Pyruvate kinase, barrel domain
MARQNAMECTLILGLVFRPQDKFGREDQHVAQRYGSAHPLHAVRIPPLPRILQADASGPAGLNVVRMNFSHGSYEVRILMSWLSRMGGPNERFSLTSPDLPLVSPIGRR